MTTHMPIPGPQVLLPLVIILSTFGFILSVILIGKSPKAGACLVGGLVFALPILLYRAALAGTFRTPMGLPFAIIPGTFLFILVVVVLSKTPKAGAVLIVVIMVPLGLFFLKLMASHRSTNQVTWVPQARQETDSGAGSAVVHQEFERVFQDYVSPPSGLAQAPTSPSAPAPIWSPGVDKELDADIYPSRLAALQAVGRRMDKSVRELVGDVNSPVPITLFQEASDPVLLTGLRNAIQQALPEATCMIEADLRNLRPNEVGVTFQFSGMQAEVAPWTHSSETRVVNGVVHVHIFTMQARITPQKQFVEAPWLDNFATFASTRPERAFIIARSRGTCTSESEANQQALDDARARLTEAIGARGGRKLGPSAPPITATDVLQGGFIVDRFAQSLEGSAAKIWRQALLIDVSGPKLAQLSKVKVVEYRQVRESYARMALSAVGVIVLIGVIYFFLNMATRGYYEWSLRIAGVVLAIVAVISILMVVQ